MGLRAACLFFHSEVDAPTTYLDRYYGKAHHCDTVLIAIQISFRLNFFAILVR